MTALLTRPSRLRLALTALGLLGTSLLPFAAGGQVADRLSRPSSLDPRVELSGSVSPRVRSAQVMGHLSGDTALTGMSLVVQPSAAQQAELTQLLADQQNPNSPLFHKWLTPEAYGARFGLSDADLGVLQNWLTTRGLTVDSVAPSRNRIVFSGTASTVESAFNTTLQRFHGKDQDYFENSTPVSLPASLAGAISGITGVSSFRLQPPVQVSQAVTPQFSGSTGYHYMVPWDFRQIFGMNTLINQGFTGSGISIGVIGQSSVDPNQITYFQSKTGQPTKLPTMVLVPNTGSAGQLSKGDEGESELDLEYASGSAPGATVLFIYTGTGNSNTNNGVFSALTYAITHNLAPILTLSYGGCEASNASYAQSTIEPILLQASSQGQTILVSSGDTGAAGCEAASNNTTIAKAGLSVQYPASSPNVTAVGGTQLTGTDPNLSSPYWSSTNNSFGGSALGYIPETSWNDTTAYGSLSATGGGFSTLFGKPSWQAGTGVPADSHRDLPDVSFPAAVEEHAYIVCTVNSPCTATAGFGSNAGGGSLVGGTSASAPNFAAMLAVVEQAIGGGALGNVNPKLYALAAGSSASTVFHDITTGNNIVSCTGGTTGCSSTNPTANGTMGYSAGTGYDLVTGLGSIDATGLSAALTVSNGSAKLTPTVTLTAANNTPSGGTADILTFSVGGSGSLPTGTVTLSIDGTAVSSLTLSSSANSATYSYSVPACAVTTTTTCVHVVIATYSGDATFYGASSTINLIVPTTATVSSGSITLTPATATLTVVAGNSVTDLITVNSSGFDGTVSYKVAASAAINACYTLPSTRVSPNASASSTFTFSTATSACSSASGAVSLNPIVSTSHPSGGTPPWQGAMGVVAAGLAGAFLLRRRIPPAALFLVLFSAGLFGLAGCGSSSTPATSSTTSSSSTAKGTYTLTITGTGVPSNGAASIAATTTLTVTVQ